MRIKQTTKQKQQARSGKVYKVGPEELAQWERALASKADDLRSIPELEERLGFCRSSFALNRLAGAHMCQPTCV